MNKNTKVSKEIKEQAKLQGPFPERTQEEEPYKGEHVLRKITSNDPKLLDEIQENVKERARTDGEHKICEITSDPKFLDEIQENLKERARTFVEWRENPEAEFEKLREISGSKSFSFVLRRKIRHSVAGLFISEFNPGNVTKEEQDSKLFLEKKFPTHCQWENDYVEDIFQAIREQLKLSTSGNIHLKDFMRQMSTLRLPVTKIGFLDESLKALKNLQVLILTGNYIDHIPFEWLPPKLSFLELAGNMVNDIQITENEPKIYYLGLSNNSINDNSIISGVFTMKYLIYLDLSDNDICQMDNLLTGLHENTSLTGLSLRGNPCSVTVGYGWKVSKALPKLVYLDGKPLKEFTWDERKQSTCDENILDSGVLQIYVFRLMGFPKPNAKRSYFEIELEVPLLDKKLKSNLKCQLEEEYLTAYPPSPKENGMVREKAPSEDYIESSADQGSIGSPLNQSGSSKSKFHKGKHQEEEKTVVYKDPKEINIDSFLNNDIVIPELTQFKSESLNWNIIIKPKAQPVFEFIIPPEEITDLRDTFRTIITIRIYSREILTQKKEPTSGDILNKLVAKIRIPAEVPFWNESYTGYTWDAKDPSLAKIYPNIGDVNFAVGGRGLLKGEDLKEGVFPPPTYLTCHLGLSLKRNIKFTKERMKSVKISSAEI